jgi:hypothetical protein
MSRMMLREGKKNPLKKGVREPLRHDFGLERYSFIPKLSCETSPLDWLATLVLSLHGLVLSRQTLKYYIFGLNDAKPGTIDQLMVAPPQDPAGEERTKNDRSGYS